MEKNYVIIDFDNLDTIKEKKSQKKKFNKNEFVFIENEKSFFKYSDKNTQREHIFQIETKKYLKDIRESYKNIFTIKKQFIADISRLHLYYNNKKITNPDIFFDYLNYKFNVSLQEKILMCCTQACLGLPYTLLMNFLEKKNIYLTDTNMSTLHDSFKNLTISFLIENNKILFKVKKYLRICKLDQNSEIKTLYIIKTKLESDLLNDKFILMNIKIINCI